MYKFVHVKDSVDTHGLPELIEIELVNDEFNLDMSDEFDGNWILTKHEYTHEVTVDDIIEFYGEDYLIELNELFDINDVECDKIITEDIVNNKGFYEFLLNKHYDDMVDDAKVNYNPLYLVEYDYDDPYDYQE